MGAVKAKPPNRIGLSRSRYVADEAGLGANYPSVVIVALLLPLLQIVSGVAAWVLVGLFAPGELLFSPLFHFSREMSAQPLANVRPP